MERVVVDEMEMPALGFGTFQLAGTTCQTAVEAALDTGYRHIDTAEYYDNEQAVGRAIQQSSVDRDEIFLTTKVWRSNLEYEAVLSAAEASLDRLGVDYVDLLLIHWPHRRVPVEETLDAMETLLDRGVTRHIGVSNFTRAQLREAQSVAKTAIVTDQVLYHPYIDQQNLRNYCVETDTVLTAYSPLARGAVLDDQTLQRLGDRYDKTAPQVAIRWLIQQPNVAAIPRSSTPAHVAENADVFDFELTESEMQEIDALTGGLSIRLRNKLPAVMRSMPF